MYGTAWTNTTVLCETLVPSSAKEFFFLACQILSGALVTADDPFFAMFVCVCVCVRERERE